MSPSYLPLSVLTLAAILGPVTLARATEIPMYIGTFTKTGDAKGIYLSQFNTETGALSEPVLVVEANSPSFLVQHPTKKFIYSVIETEAGAVCAFAVDAGGKLREVNRQPSLGGIPTHISIDREGKNVVVANYGAGSISCLPIAEDGSLKPATGFVQHKGTGPNPARQKGPHAHSVYVDEANTHVYACDLGLDKIFVYRFNPAAGSLEPSDPAFATTPPGAGPRHLAFSAGDEFVYCVNEMGNSITSFQRAGSLAVLKEIQTIPTIPANYAEAAKNTTAEIQMHPSQKFVYASNRGHNSIAGFARGQDGKLTFISHTPTQGKDPRFFGIEPGGNFLVAGNQNSNTIVVFRIDQKTGRLQPVGAPVKCGQPGCFLWAKWPK